MAGFWCANVERVFSAPLDKGEPEQKGSMLEVVIYFAATYFIVLLLLVVVLLGRWGVKRLRQEQRHSVIVYGACFVLLASPWFPCLALATAGRTLVTPDVIGAFNASYFVLTYSFVFTLLLVWFLALRQDKHRRNAVPWLISLALLLSPWFPYGVIFAQTALFGRGLLPSVHQAFHVCATDCGDEDEPILDYQVLRITPSHAEVLVVQPCIGGMAGVDAKGRAYEGTIGWVLHFQKTAHDWKYQGRADMPWSSCGSADSNVFPPYAIPFLSTASRIRSQQGNQIPITNLAPLMLHRPALKGRSSGPAANRSATGRAERPLCLSARRAVGVFASQTGRSRPGTFTARQKPVRNIS